MNVDDFEITARESRLLREAIAEVTLAWSDVENDLAILLREIIEPKTPGAFAFAIYFALSSVDARLNVVNAAFKTLAEVSPEFSRIDKTWRRTNKTIKELKIVRNAVAHGQITSVGISGKNHIRLTPPIFDWRRMNPGLLRDQAPGFASEDLKVQVKAMRAASSELTHWFDLARSLHQRDETSLVRALDSIERHQAETKDFGQLHNQ